MSKPIVNLVQISPQLLVPVTPQDYTTLNDHEFTAARIPTGSLGLIKSTLLRSVDLKIVDHDTVIHGLFAEFQKALSSLPDSKVKARDNDELLVLHYTGDLELLDPTAVNAASEAAAKQQAFEKAFEKCCAYARKYLGMYCRRLVIQQKDRPDAGGTMYRLYSVLDESINNAMFYSVQFSTPTVATLDLGSSYRVRFELDTLSTKPILRITSEDLCGGDWQSNNPRTFQVNQVHSESVGNLVNFLLSHLVSGGKV